jgi:hypothetical protein
MATKDNTHKKNNAANRQPSPQTKPTNTETIGGRAEPMLPVQQGSLDRNNLTSSDVIYLQRKVGNRAVNRILTPPVPNHSTPTTHLIAQRTRAEHNNLDASFQPETDQEQAALPSFSRQSPETNRLLPSLTVSNSGSIQLTPETYVGATQEGYQLQDTEGGAGNTKGEWHKPGEGGFSRLMQGSAGEMVEGMAESGALEGMLLKHVAPDLSGIPAQQKKWLDWATEAKEKIDSWSYGFAPGSIREMYQQRYESSSKQVEVIEKCGAELQQKAGKFNSFVPQGNGFFVSAARLSSMQAMLGASDNAGLSAALVQGLKDAEDVMKRYRDKYEDGDRRLTTEKLDPPEADESVSQAATEMTDVSRELDAAYMGFQTTVLSGKIGAIKQEYAKDEERLKEINEVKQFVRNVGKTVDFTMSVVRGAPTMATNVTNSVRKTKASVNAARNKRDIIAGNRPRFNPTYVTSDKDGNMVVRNMQTGLDRNMVTGEKVPSPVDEGISLPKDVSGVLGKIADFVYHEEVKQINLRLEQMKIKVNGVKGVIDATLFEQRIVEYQNALNHFATKAAALEASLEERRKEYREFGMQLDRYAQIDRETRKAGQGLAKGAERYTTIMTMVAAVQEMLAIGSKSQGAAPSDLPAWWATVRKRRFSIPTEGETRTAVKMQQQIVDFRASVKTAKETFGSVSAQAQNLLGQY